MKKRLNLRQRKARKEFLEVVYVLVGAIIVVPPVLALAFYIGQDMAARAIGAK
ncbi:MAG: hypothetical protein ACXW1D_00375 [Halobacteriota archaeon]